MHPYTPRTQFARHLSSINKKTERMAVSFLVLCIRASFSLSFLRRKTSGGVVSLANRPPKRSSPSNSAASDGESYQKKSFRRRAFSGTPTREASSRTQDRLLAPFESLFLSLRRRRRRRSCLAAGTKRFFGRHITRPGSILKV